MNQEHIMQMQMIEQESNQLEQQLQLIEQHSLDMHNLIEALNGIDKSEDKTILAGLGKGIYIPSEIKSKELIVEVGNKCFVKKSIPDTKNIIQREIEKLDSAKHKISQMIEELQERMTEMLAER